MPMPLVHPTAPARQSGGGADVPLRPRCGGRWRRRAPGGDQAGRHAGADVHHAWILRLGAGRQLALQIGPPLADLRRAAVPGGVKAVAQDAVGDAWGEGGAAHLVVDRGADRVVGAGGQYGGLFPGPAAPFFTGDEAGAERGAGGAQQQHGGQPAAVGNAACGQHGDVAPGIHHRRQQGQGTGHTRVAARLRPLGNDGVDARLRRALRLGHGLHLGKDQHPAGLRRGDVGGGVGKGVVDGGHPCVEGDLDEVVDIGE